MAKSLAEQIGNKCIHFNGVTNDVCEMGIKYNDVRDMSLEGPKRYPCFKEGECVACPARQFPTDEEVAAEVKAIGEHSARTMKAMAAVYEDAKAKGLKKGKGGTGSIKCPVCENGTLGYSVASLNGHVWGKCSTEDCVAWMM